MPCFVKKEYASIGRAIRPNTSRPVEDVRVQTLYWLQDNGYRTFGMLCPSLPQDDYGVFADHAAQAIRAGQCEHVWAEVLNARGKSLTRTCEGLRGSGFE